MIVFFVGTPGSGKSYEAVKKIVDNLRLGRVVCTNVDGMDSPVCQEYIKHLLNFDDYTFKRQFRYLSKDEILRFWETETVLTPYRVELEDGTIEDTFQESQELICPHNSLIVIDEVHKYFNSRDWQSESNRKLADWASTHRHNGYDLVMITQSIDKVDKQVRTLTEWTYFFRKVNFLGSMVQKKYMKYSYAGDDHDGKALANSVNTYDSRIFPCYSSYATTDAKEVGFMQHINVLKHPVFFAIPVVICLCIYFFTKSSLASGDLFGVNKVKKQYQAMQKTAAKKSAPAFAAVPVQGQISTVNVNLPPGKEVDTYIEKVTPKNSSLVRGYVQHKDLYAVLLDDGTIIEQKNKPVVGKDVDFVFNESSKNNEIEDMQ